MRRIVDRSQAEQGFALVVALLTMATIAGVAAAAFRMSHAHIMMGRNYHSASQTLFAAEAGVMHAVALMNETGIVDLTDDVVAGWPGGRAPFADGTNRLSNDDAYEYDVLAQPDPYSADRNRAVLISTGRGRQRAERVVLARIARNGVDGVPPGALYLATDDPANTAFDGNAFTIDGNDRCNGAPGPRPPIPGIGAHVESNAETTRAALSGPQQDNVRGLGYIADPRTPSVLGTNGPSDAEVDALIESLLALPHTRISGPAVAGNPVLGTEAAPQITYLDSSTGTRLLGTVTGVGILIVESDLRIEGNLDFKGLVLVRGETRVSGNATVQGSVWTTGFVAASGGSAIIQYCSTALAYAAQSGGGGAASVPAPVVVIAWGEQF